MRYGGANAAFFSRSGVTVVPAATQSKSPESSASKMPLKSAPSYGTNSTLLPSFLAISVIRSMSRPPSSGMPLNGGSGKAAPTLSVFMGSR